MTASHLNPKILYCLELSAAERINYIRRDRFIPYARGEAVLAEIDTIIQAPAGVRAKCLLLVAAPGMGKTAIIDFAERRYLESPPGRSRRGGLVRINLPQIVSDRRLFYARILKYLGIPFRMSDKADFLHEQAVDALRDSEARALVIDEFHNFLGSKMTHLPEHMVAIRDISNIPISIIGAGTRSAEACIVADDQLEQRFTRQWLTPWEETEELRNFLATLETRLPLRFPSDLSGPDLLPLLVRISNGHMRRMISLIRLAAESAVVRRDERITVDLLRQATRELSRTSRYYVEAPAKEQAKSGAPAFKEAEHE